MACKGLSSRAKVVSFSVLCATWIYNLSPFGSIAKKINFQIIYHTHIYLIPTAKQFKINDIFQYMAKIFYPVARNKLT